MKVVSKRLLHMVGYLIGKIKILFSCRHNSYYSPDIEKYFSRSTLTLFKRRIQGSYKPWDGVCCDNSCGRVCELTSQSKEINDRSCCDKHRGTRVHWLIHGHIFFMSVETSLYISCVLAYQHAHNFSSPVKSKLHVNS